MSMNLGNFGTILLIILIALILLLIYNLIWPTKLCRVQDNMVNITPIENPTWNRNSCVYKMGSTLKTVLDDNKIARSNNNNIHVPCSYDYIEREIMNMTPKQDQRIYIIHNADNLAAKDRLWKNLADYYGLDKARQYMPNTYILYADMDRFKQEYQKDKLYIMKKNIQKQEGLKITDSFQEILNGYNNGYVVAQNCYKIHILSMVEKLI